MRGYAPTQVQPMAPTASHTGRLCAGPARDLGGDVDGVVIRHDWKAGFTAAADGPGKWLAGDPSPVPPPGLDPGDVSTTSSSAAFPQASGHTAWIMLPGQSRKPNGEPSPADVLRPDCRRRGRLTSSVALRLCARA